jgi:hypothetical protein
MMKNLSQNKQDKSKNRSQSLDRLAEALLEREEITGDETFAIIHLSDEPDNPKNQEEA